MRLIYNSDFINAMQANREKFGVLAMPIENAICDIVSNLPTIDAVQVVRCKECKHWKKDIFQTGDNFVGICRRKAAIKSEFPCTADGFCSWAERRKEQ